MAFLDDTNSDIRHLLEKVDRHNAASPDRIRVLVSYHLVDIGRPLREAPFEVAPNALQVLYCIATARLVQKEPVQIDEDGRGHVVTKSSELTAVRIQELPKNEDEN